MLSHILVPAAFSTRCRGAAGYAAALARRFHTHVTVLHVVETGTALGFPEAAYADDFEYLPKRTVEAQRTLDAWVAEDFLELPVTTKVVNGDPAGEIARAAREGGADLIVMPTHGHGPFRRFLLGSVTAKVLHDAGCPVWTGPHLEDTPSPPDLGFRNVLCAIDLGPASATVLCWATQMAREFGARLTVTHILPAATSNLGGFRFDPDWTVEVIRRAKDRIAEMKLEMPAEVIVEVGEAHLAVPGVARQTGADLLVIGRGGHGGVLRNLRATAYAILRESACPVLAV